MSLMSSHLFPALLVALAELCQHRHCPSNRAVCFFRSSRTINCDSMNPSRSCWTKRAPSGKPSATPTAWSSSHYTTETPANASLGPKSLPCKRRRRKRCRRRGCERWRGHPLCGGGRQRHPTVTGPAPQSLREPRARWPSPEGATHAFGSRSPATADCVRVSPFCEVLPLWMVKPDFLRKAAPGLVQTRWQAEGACFAHHGCFGKLLGMFSPGWEAQTAGSMWEK